MTNYNVYNYYSMAYLPKTDSKYHTHKSKELKNLYQSMVRHNKQSPLYKFNLSAETQDYALSIKDAAIDLKNISSFLSDDTDTVFNQKIFASSDESVLNARITTDDYDKAPDNLNIQVKQLANNQVNEGNYITSKSKTLASGTYDVKLATSKSEFMFTVKVDASVQNIDVQRSLANAINQNHTGLKATVVANTTGQSALNIESQMTGKGALFSDLQFAFTENNPDQPLVELLGLNQIKQMPSNSAFSINGQEHGSATNNISINNVVEVDLLQVSDEPVSISMVPDTDEILKKVHDFVDSYNHLIKLANDNMDNQKSARKLLTDISRITRYHASALEANGLKVNAECYIETEEALLVKSAKNGEFKSLFNDISDFQTEVMKTTDQLNMDPLAYVDKVIVTYPNTAKSLPNPYVPSMYSGLLFNGYA